MSDKQEEQQQQHIPTESPDKGEEEQAQGSGGLLSKIGDPAGTFPATFPFPLFSQTY